jgi:hypothetical protein
MFTIGLRCVLGAITNAYVAKGLKQLNRGHVLYLFHKCYLLIDRVYSRAHEVTTVVTDV